MVRVAIILACVAVAGACGPVSPPAAVSTRAPAPVPQASSPRPPPDESGLAPPVAHPTYCRYGFGVPPLSVTPDRRGNLNSASFAYTGGRALVAYGTFEGHGVQIIRARLVDVARRELGPELSLSPEDALSVSPVAVALADRFFVGWREGEAWRGRTVGRDGALGPTTKLPVGSTFYLELARRQGAIEVTWAEGGGSKCAIRRVTFDPTSGEVGRPVTLAEGPEISCQEPAPDATLGGGSTWFAYAFSDAGASEVSLVPVDSAGARPAGPLLLTTTSSFATSTSVVGGPSGGLVAWAESDASHVADLAINGARTIAVDEHGHARADARAVPDLSGPYLRARLLDVRGAPVLWANSKVVPLDWDGTPLGPAVDLMPRVYGLPEFARTEGDPLLLWSDQPHGRRELFLAPLRCDGSPPATDPEPWATARASSPPPPAPRSRKASCPLHLALDAPLAAPRGVPFGPTLLAMGDGAWVAWPDYRDTPSGGQAATLYLQRFRGGRPVAPEASLGVGANGGALGSADGKQALLFAPVVAETHVDVARLGSDGTLDRASARPVSDPLATAVSPVAVTSEGTVGLFFLEGDGLTAIYARAEGPREGPIVRVSSPGIQAYAPVVAAAPGGWVAAWSEGVDAVRVARLLGPDMRVAWTARAAGVSPNIAFSRLGAAGMLGDQVDVVLQLNSTMPGARLVRFTLDGARLDDVDLPGVAFLGAAVGEGMITLLSRGPDGPDRQPRYCVARLAPDGRSLAPSVCAHLASDPETSATTAPQNVPARLSWSGDSLWSSSLDARQGIAAAAVREWKCAP